MRRKLGQTPMTDNEPNEAELNQGQVESKEIGKPIYFDIDHYLDSVEQVICADEIEFALKMIDNMPGFYRENVPPRALDIRRIINRQLMSVVDYAQDPGEMVDDHFGVSLKNKIDTVFAYPRGLIICDLVKRLNENDKVPHLVEFGPADFWVYHGLKDKGLNFTYEPITVHKSAFKKHVNELEPRHEGSPLVFVCFEVIEHLWRPEDIRHFYDKSCPDGADYILLSTPLNTLGGGMENWKERELGHIRTYTQKEFSDFAKVNFGGYIWTHYVTDNQVLLGSLEEVNK